MTLSILMMENDEFLAKMPQDAKYSFSSSSFILGRHILSALPRTAHARSHFCSHVVWDIWLAMRAAVWKQIRQFFFKRARQT